MMLIHARDTSPGDVVLTPQYSSYGVRVKSVTISEDGSTMLKYEDDTVEWFDSINIILRKDNVE